MTVLGSLIMEEPSNGNPKAWVLAFPLISTTKKDFGQVVDSF